MRGKPVDIGNTVRRGLLHFRRTGATETPEQDSDAGNGACMRTLPVALATFGRSGAEIRQAVLAQAHITHNNRLSDAGTLCVVQMIHALLRGAKMSELIHGPVQELIAAHPQFRFRDRRRTNPSGYIVDTLQAVFQALFDTDNFTDCVIDVVNRGGDADTTGAIAGMLAGALYGIDAIPSDWWYPLDIDVYRSCHTQAQALLTPALRRQAGALAEREMEELALAG
jgi:ADP-ribosyl-[dinitrogen reductase] hydrolase